jgi:hypothetical protein
MARAHRTYWRIRQRYRRFGYAGSILGGFIAAAIIAPLVHSAEWAAEGEAFPMLLQWIALFVGAVALPPLVARLAWRRHRRRYIEDIYQLSLR